MTKIIYMRLGVNSFFVLTLNIIFEKDSCERKVKKNAIFVVTCMVSTKMNIFVPNGNLADVLT